MSSNICQEECRITHCEEEIIYVDGIFGIVVSGVLAMAWCPSDSSLMLSCAKDNRTLCWDTLSGQVSSSQTSQI